jgi:protein TonB
MIFLPKLVTPQDRRKAGADAASIRRVMTELMVCAELYDPPRRGDWLRWCACGAVVLGLHSAVLLALTHRSDPDLQAGAPVVMVDFSPVWAAPRADPSELPPGPQQVETQQIDQVRQEHPIDHQEAAPADQVKQEQPVERREHAAVEQLPPGATPVIVAAPHLTETATETPPTEARKVPDPTAEKVVDPEATKDRKTPDRTVQQEVHLQATAAAAPPSAITMDLHPASPAPGTSRPAAAAVMTWRRMIAAQIKRHHRYPPDAEGQHGTATLAFRIDRQGRVVSRRIVHSAGSPILDKDALALIMRAQPFPAPPPGTADEALSMTVPVEFLRVDDP